MPKKAGGSPAFISSGKSMLFMVEYKREISFFIPLMKCPLGKDKLPQKHKGTELHQSQSYQSQFIALF